MHFLSFFFSFSFSLSLSLSLSLSFCHSLSFELSVSVSPICPHCFFSLSLSQRKQAKSWCRCFAFRFRLASTPPTPARRKGKILGRPESLDYNPGSAPRGKCTSISAEPRREAEWLCCQIKGPQVYIPSASLPRCLFAFRHEVAAMTVIPA